MTPKNLKNSLSRLLPITRRHTIYADKIKIALISSLRILIFSQGFLPRIKIKPVKSSRAAGLEIFSKKEIAVKKLQAAAMIKTTGRRLLSPGLLPGSQSKERINGIAWRNF